MPRPCMPKGYEVSTAPGKGPCDDDACKSAGCASARLLARTLCRDCRAPLGHDNPVLFDRPAPYHFGLSARHESCAAAASRGAPS